MKNPTMTQQNADVLDFMQRNGVITTMDAFDKLKITRLSARIWDLRHLGFEIIGTDKSRKENGHVIRWREYRLA
jgi:hypothetical protein